MKTEIPFPGIRQNNHHVFPRSQILRGLMGGTYRSTGGDTHQQAFFPGQPLGKLKRVFVGYGVYFVYD